MHDDVDIIEGKALAALRAGDYDAAIALVEQALALGGDTSDRFRVLLSALQTEEAEVMGLRLFLPRDVVTPSTLFALASGTFELNEREAAIGDIRPDDRVLELGAGLGTVTLALCLLHPDTPVTALEANPRLEDVLSRNIAQNQGQAEIIGALAALEDGETDFHIAPDFVASSMLHPAPGARTERRPMVDVNRLLRETAATVLIMDIEGAELAILNGLDLTPLRRIVAEFHPRICSDTEITDTIAHLIASGFDLNLAHCGDQVLTFDRRPAAHHQQAKT